MPLRWSRLRESPAVCHHLTGLGVGPFEALVTDIPPRLGQPPRRRNRPFRLGHADQLLLAAAWLRHSPTQEALGALFGVSDSTALRVVARWAGALAATGPWRLRPPCLGRGKRKPLRELLAGVPGLAGLAEAPEQTEGRRDI